MDKYKVTIPEGQSGDWRVARFTVSEEDARFASMRAAIKGGRGHIHAGTYTALYRGRKIIMSDTPDEIRDLYVPFLCKSGRVLVNGLGLGVVVCGMMSNGVDHVTVIEQSKDVIQLVGRHLMSRYPGRLKLIHQSAFDYQPAKGERYNYVWHDIWDDICADNLDEMKILHRKWGRRCDDQGSWCRGLCERQAKKGW